MGHRPTIVGCEKSDDQRSRKMTQLDTLLQNNQDVQQFALAVLSECEDLRGLAVRCVEAMINSAMSAQADELCGARYNERSEGRVNSRNGYRGRGLETTVGDVEIRIPKLRHGTYYPEGIIEHWQRADNALVAALVEMYANGVSTAKVERVARELGVGSMSKSQVSRLCSALDEEVAQLRESELSGHVVRYVWVDATYVSCRVAGRFRNVAVVTAIGCDETGHKRFLGLDVVDVESYEDWKRFLLSLRERGLGGVRLVTSDAHAGIVRAVSEVFLGSSWQRCVTHFMRNCADAYKGRPAKQRLVRECLKATFAQAEPAVVRACFHEASARLRDLGCPKASDLMDEAEPSVLCYLDFPQSHAKKIRTDNVQERANREIKRRTDVVQCFPSRESLLRLVGAVLCEENAYWSGKRMFSEDSIAGADHFVADKPTELEVAQACAKAREIIGKAVATAEEKE
ncbi:MAG: IS256 family transposase [Atopobiaceae bacterium]|nr:IS256 family transposase [Atopobiaceae bacterium]